MSSTPTSNGRDGKGRFTKGNAGGPGNPHAAQAARLRSALLDAVTPEDMAEVAQVLLREAKAGNVQAGRELLDRVLGKAHQTQSTDIAATVTRDDAETRVTQQLVDLLGGQMDAPGRAAAGSQ